MNHASDTLGYSRSLNDERSLSAVYCTVCDAAYVPRALALHSSLRKFNARARFAYFCVDGLSADLLEGLDLQRALVIREEDFAEPGLKRLRSSRTLAEYCWTCKPFALEYLARTLPSTDWLVYLDSDMLLFGDPDSALPGPEVHYLLTPHRYVPAMAGYASSAGLYNAGYLAARRSAEGLQALQWWRERCIERCSAQPTLDSYSDQKYLDRLPGLFPFGEASAHEGLNVAPWNIGHYRVSARNGWVQVGDTRLLLYHFQGLRVLTGWLMDLYSGDWRVPAEVRDLIYRPYLEQLRAAYGALENAAPGRAPGVTSALRGPRDWLRLGYETARGYHNLVRYRLVA